MLGYILKLTRIANDMSIKQAAEKTGVSSAYFSEIESGNKKPTLSMLKKICETYNLPVSSLLSFEEIATAKNLNYQEALIMILKYYVNKLDNSLDDNIKQR